jgi:hypothetical protein
MAGVQFLSLPLLPPRLTRGGGALAPALEVVARGGPDGGDTAEWLPSADMSGAYR